MQLLLDNLPLLLVASVFAPLTAWFAAQRSRHPGIWFVFGALLGPLAMAVLALAPPGRCPACGAPVHGWVTECVACGRALGGIGEPAVPEGMILPAAPSLAGGNGTRRPPRRVGKRGRPGADAGGDQMALDTQVLSTGIYLSGSAGLEIGACYALARLPAPEGDRFRVFGPVDTGQITVRHERPMRDVEVTVMNDRIIISGRSDRSSPTFVFQAIGGMRGEDLERAFGSAPVRRS